MKRPQKLAVMLVPTPPYEICGLITFSLAAIRGQITPLTGHLRVSRPVLGRIFTSNL